MQPFLLVAAALLIVAASHAHASSHLPRSLAANKTVQLKWQTYTASLTHEGVATKGVGSIVMLNSTTAVVMLMLHEIKGFDVVSVQLYNASQGPSSPTLLTLLNDTAPPQAENSAPNYLALNVNDTTQLNKLLVAGHAGIRVTTPRHPVGALTSTMKPGITKTTSAVSVAAQASSASDFSSILQYVQVILQGAEVLVKVGLPAITSTPVQFIANAAVVFLAELPLHERLSGPPVSGASAFQPLLRDAKTANQAYDVAFTAATNCTAYLAGILNASTIVDCSTVSSVNRQPYFVYVEHETQRVVVSIRGSESVLDWSTNADATTVVIAPTVGAHKGMFASAEQLLGRTATKLNAALAANPGYTLTFIGHSLGAGVGALAAYMVKNSVSQGSLLSAAAPGVSAACFSTPPVLTMDAAASAQAYITTLLTEDDVVPRASLGNADSVIVQIDTRKLSPFAQKAAADKIAIDLSYSSYQVTPSISTGTEVLYQMYAPGTMLQLTSAGGGSADDSCLGPMLSGKGVNDRLKAILLKINMVNDHNLAKMIRCLTAHLS